MPIRLLIADDHRLVLDGLRHLIEHEPDLCVVAEALNGEEAVRLHQETGPDLAIIDFSMPVMNGLEATRRILAERPGARVIMLSMHEDRRFAVESLKAGARGYILKDTAFAEFVQAIRTVMAGRLFLSAPLDGLLLEELVVHLKAESDTAPPRLSSREREVLQLYAEGHSTREIAARLHLSVKTVETHRAQIMDKLGLHTIAGLTKYATREGLTSIE